MPGKAQNRDLPDLLDRLSSIGDRLGFLFQLTDDILDMCGSREEMGKEVFKDRDQGKRNLLSLMDLDSARTRAGTMAENIAGDLMKLPGDWEEISSLALYLPVRRH